MPYLACPKKSNRVFLWLGPRPPTGWFSFWLPFKPIQKKKKRGQPQNKNPPEHALGIGEPPENSVHINRWSCALPRLTSMPGPGGHSGAVFIWPVWPIGVLEGLASLRLTSWLWVKNRCSKWVALVNGNMDYKYAAPWWVNFDPFPF